MSMSKFNEQKNGKNVKENIKTVSFKLEDEEQAKVNEDVNTNKKTIVKRVRANKKLLFKPM